MSRLTIWEQPARALPYSCDAAPTQVGAILAISANAATRSLQAGYLQGAGATAPVLPVFEDEGGAYLALVAGDGTAYRLALPPDFPRLSGALSYVHAVAPGGAAGVPAEMQVCRADISAPRWKPGDASLLASWPAPVDPSRAAVAAGAHIRRCIGDARAIIEEAHELIGPDGPISAVVRVARRLAGDRALLSEILDRWSEAEEAAGLLNDGELFAWYRGETVEALLSARDPSAARIAALTKENKRLRAALGEEP